MKQAIEVKVLPRTEKKPARLKATSCSGLSVTQTLSNLPANGPRSEEWAIALELCQRLGWQGTLAVGALSGGDRIVFVLCDDDDSVRQIPIPAD